MKLFRGIDELYTLAGVEKKNGRHPQFADLGLSKNAAIVVDKKKVVYSGTLSRIPKNLNSKISKEIDLGGGLVLPGLVECHTHCVFGGDRSDEFEMRNQGVSYQEIAEKGGGILSTVKKTRSASEETLLKSAQSRVDHFLDQGVCLLEIKSGYGLTLAAEKKILSVMSQLKGPKIIRTFLGAHAIPQGETAASYLEKLKKGLKSLRGLADRVDIFVEKGYFSCAEAEEYLREAQRLGFAVTIHAEQMNRTGATEVGLALNAHSLDHLVQLSSASCKKFSRSETTAVLLPAADFYLKMKYPPARKLIDAGARVALATDYNPGSSPTRSVEFVGVLSRLMMKMSLPEVIAGYTYNAAAALNQNVTHGSLVTGKAADFVHMDMGYSELFYEVGSWRPRGTYISGLKKSRR